MSEDLIGDWWIGDDFIGVFDTNYDTSKMIDFWHQHHNDGATVHRIGFPSRGNPVGNGNDRNDEFINELMMPIDYHGGMRGYQAEYNYVISECLKLYTERFSTISTFPMLQVKLNIQRTQPKGGYHRWHCENHGPEFVRDRLLATMMYLNTIPPEGGGETEFIYQSKRFNPVAGRVLIWPAGFTHTHRGNPPLKEDKFIATSWVEQQHPPMNA